MSLYGRWTRCACMAIATGGPIRTPLKPRMSGLKALNDSGSVRHYPRGVGIFDAGVLRFHPFGCQRKNALARDDGFSPMNSNEWGKINPLRKRRRCPFLIPNRGCVARADRLTSAYMREV
jgi:hypothetical protein